MPWWHRLQIRGKKMSIVDYEIDKDTTLGELQQMIDSANRCGDIDAAVCLTEFYEHDFFNANHETAKEFGLLALDLIDSELDADPNLEDNDSDLFEHYEKIKESLGFWRG